MGQVIKIGHEPGRATHACGYWRNVNRRQRVVKMASVSPADIRRIHPNYLELYQQYFESDNSEEFSGFEEEFDILDKVAPDNRDFFLKNCIWEKTDDEILGFNGVPESQSDSEENNGTQDCQQDPPRLHDWRRVDGNRVII